MVSELLTKKKYFKYNEELDLFNLNNMIIFKEKNKMNTTIYSFRIATKGSNKTTFKVEFKDIDNYKIITDLSGNFEHKFLRIMKGQYSYSYLDKKNSRINFQFIDEKDPIKNLEKYAKECAASFYTVATLKKIPYKMNKEELTILFEQIKKDINGD